MLKDIVLLGIAHFILFSDHGIKFWVGANDKNDIHTFSWTDGKPLIINSNPNPDLTNANCVLVGNSRPADYTAVSCQEKHAFICERSKSIRAR